MINIKPYNPIVRSNILYGIFMVVGLSVTIGLFGYAFGVWL